jgi:uncharacterized surface anchored protein
VSVPIPPLPSIAADATVLVNLILKDRITGALLAGALFNIVPCGASGPVQTVTVPPGGSVTLPLPPGCYAAIEVAAAAGYVLDTTPWLFTAVAGMAPVGITNAPENLAPQERNPDQRVPLQNVPAGPTEQA